MHNSRQTFFAARVTLTTIYLALVSIILFIFSTTLFIVQSRDVITIVVKHQYGNQIPRSLTEIERQDIKYQASLLRFHLIQNLFLIDLLILIIGGFASFFLAGKTLRPINEAIIRQKEFTQDASHELRTPITAIISATEVALRVKNQPLSEYRDVLGQIHTESLRLSRIVDELLMLSRADSGTIPLQNSLLNLSNIVANTIVEMTPVAEKKHITLHKSLMKNVMVRGDEDKLKQLLLILIDNAVKYTPTKGTVTVKLVKKQKPIIHITDTGIGIDQQDIKHIFERFYRADKSRGKGGAGLGLAIAKWIVSMHDGTLSVTSRKGKGSTFTTVFPNP